jgi:ribosomal protein L12E/L44/L45/RPP1/RPP2
MDSDLNIVVETEQYSDTCVASMSAVLAASCEASRDFGIEELKQLAKKKEIGGKIKEMIPYLYAFAFLSFCGREMTSESVTKVMSISGLKADPAVIKALTKLHVGSHIPYINAYYFLLALGMPLSKAKMLKLVDAIGMEPNEARLKEALDFICKGNDYCNSLIH